MDWVMCWERKDATSFDGNENDQPKEGWIERHPTQSETIMQQASQTQNGTQ